MLILNQESENPRLDEIRALSKASRDDHLHAQRRREINAWVGPGLNEHAYLKLDRTGEAPARHYVINMTGLSRARFTLPLGQFAEKGTPRAGESRRHRSRRRYTGAGVALLVEVGQARVRSNGPATCQIPEREYTVAGQAQYERLATIQITHIQSPRPPLQRAKHVLFKTLYPKASPAESHEDQTRLLYHSHRVDVATPICVEHKPHTPNRGEELLLVPAELNVLPPQPSILPCWFATESLFPCPSGPDRPGISGEVIGCYLISWDSMSLREADSGMVSPQRSAKSVVFRWLVEYHLEVACFVLLVVLLLWPLLPLGPTATDDAVWMVRSHQNIPSQVWDWATSQGRLWPLVSGYILQFVLDSQGGAVGASLRYAPFAVFLVLSISIIAVRFGPRAAGAFAAIYLSFFAVRWDGSLLTSYPSYTWIFCSCFLGASLLFRRYLSKQHAGTLCVAAALLFLSLFVNEGLAALLSVLWAVDMLTHTARLGRPSWRAFKSSPITQVVVAGALSIGAYAMLYVVWRLTHGSTYDGLKPAPFSIGRILHTLFPFALSGSILYDLFSTIRVTYVEAGLKGGLQQSYPPGSYVWLGHWSASQALAALASFILMFRALRSVPRSLDDCRKKYALLALIGLLIAFLPIIPVSLSTQYQNWANELGVRSYSHTVISHTGVSLIIVSLLLLIESISLSARSALRISVAALTALAAGTGTGMNHDVASSMWADSGRWPIVRSLVKAKPGLCGKGALVWAPRLWEGTWYSVVGPGYWSDYSRFVLGCELTFVGTDLPLTSTLQPLYLLDYQFPSQRQSAVAWIVETKPSESSTRLSATRIDFVSIGLSRLERSKLHLAYRTNDGLLRQRGLSEAWLQGYEVIGFPLDERPPLDTIAVLPQSIVNMPETGCRWPYTIGAAMRFNETDLGCSATNVLKSGWYPQEQSGTWSKGPTSVIDLPLASIPQRDLTVDLNIESYTSLFTSKITQSVTLYANDVKVGEWSFQHGRTAVQRKAAIPASVFREPRLVLTFQNRNPVAPKSIGMGEDQRALGINLRAIRIGN